MLSRCDRRCGDLWGNATPNFTYHPLGLEPLGPSIAYYSIGFTKDGRMYEEVAPLGKAGNL
jgi:hypothetical protein